MTDVFPCTRCGDMITDGYMIGDGDGMGQRFAHPECYREYPGAYKYRQVFEVELATEKAAHARTQEWLDRFQGEVSEKIIEIERLKKEKKAMKAHLEAVRNALHLQADSLNAIAADLRETRRKIMSF